MHQAFSVFLHRFIGVHTLAYQTRSLFLFHPSAFPSLQRWRAEQMR